MAKWVVLQAVCLCLLMGVAAAADDAKGTDSQHEARGEAYYHYSMGHIYSELAGMYGNRGNYLSKAIDHFKMAIKADPDAGFLADELSDLYVQAGRYNEAVSEAEDRLKKDPGATDARRVLGRIYARLIGDPQQGKINPDMLQKAIEQYRKIVEVEPGDGESWLLLGRLYRVSQNSVESEKAYRKALEIDPGSEEAMTGLAIVYSEVGDNKRAIEMLERAVRQSPNPRTLATLANSLEQMRDYKGAADVLRRALDLSPANLELKRALGRDLMLSNQPDAALQVYKEVVGEDSKDVQSHLRIAQVYRQKRDFRNAHSALDQAKQLDPDNIESRYEEVNLLEAQGMSADALSRMEELVELASKRSGTGGDGSRAALLERLGIMYKSGEQYRQAVETFRKMEEASPDAGPRAAAQIMDTYRQAKDLNKALEEAEAAFKKYPGDRTAAMVRASLLADTGKGELAVAEMKKLFDGKNDREVWLGLAQIYEKTKNHPEMAKALDQAEKLSGSDDDRVTVLFMRGAMHERQKQMEAAEAEFRKVLAIDPDNASAMNYLGYMLADRNMRLEEAHKLISRALELEPNNGAFLDSLGWVYYRMNKFEEAETYLRRALERVSRDPTVRDHLGDALAARGKLKEAIAQWEISLREWESSPDSERDPAEAAKISAKLEGAKVRLAKEAMAPVAKP